jgi:hemoglobin-like flavoprotein
MSVPGSSTARAEEAPGDDSRVLVDSLHSLGGLESELAERVFDLFFERHPEVRSLFGEYGLNEREEMVRETLVSVLGHAEGEPWLEENLRAMGKSHAEYGVEGHSYADFVSTLLDTLDQMAPPGWNPVSRAAWNRALDRLTETMRQAGDAVGTD